MAHKLAFTRMGVWEDVSVLEPVIRAYFDSRKVHVSDMVNFLFDPFRDDRLATLAEFAIDSGVDSWIYDIGKFGSYHCEKCQDDDIEYGSYHDECVEEL